VNERSRANVELCNLVFVYELFLCKSRKSACNPRNSISHPSLFISLKDINILWIKLCVLKILSQSFGNLRRIRFLDNFIDVIIVYSLLVKHRIGSLSELVSNVDNVVINNWRSVLCSVTNLALVRRKSHNVSIPDVDEHIIIFVVLQEYIRNVLSKTDVLVVLFKYLYGLLILSC